MAVQAATAQAAYAAFASKYKVAENGIKLRFDGSVVAPTKALASLLEDEDETMLLFEVVVVVV